MKSITLLSLLLLIPVMAFAQSKITINFDESSFEAGQIAELKGTVDPSLAGKPVAVEVKDSQGQVIILRTVQPDANGNFVLKFKVPATIQGGELQVSSSIESEGETISESTKIEVPISSVDIEPKPTVPKCGAGTVLENGICVPEKKAVTESKSGKSSGCLIATATFGTELAPQVQLLREVRDGVLYSTKAGTTFMTGFNEFYYSFSPTIADLERTNPVFKETVKMIITPMLSTLSILNYVDIDSESEMLGYGIGIILLNVGMYFVVPTMIILFLIKPTKSIRKYSKYYLIPIIILSLSIIVSIPSVNAQQYTPLNLSNNNGQSSPQNLAHSGDNLYVVWMDNTLGNWEIYFKRSTDSGITFGNTVNLSNSAGFTSMPTISASGNNIYVTWHDGISGDYNDIFFTRSTDGGITFSNPINLSITAETSDNPQIIGSGNNVYVTWQERISRSSDGGNSDIFFTRSTDGGITFSNPINVSNTAGQSHSFQMKTSGNNVYVVWRDTTDPTNGGIYFAKSTDGGITFSSSKNVNDISGYSDHPDVATSGNNVYVIWQTEPSGKTNQVYLAKSTNNGDTFSNPKNLSKNPTETRNMQIVASGNNVYVLMNDFGSPAPNMYDDVYFTKSIDRGDTFSTPINLSNTPKSSSYPKMVVSENNIYVSWSDGSYSSPNMEILLAKSTNNGDSFSTPINLSNSPTQSSGVQLDLLNNNLYVLWTEVLSSQNYDVFFSLVTSSPQDGSFVLPCSMQEKGDGVFTSSCNGVYENGFAKAKVGINYGSGLFPIKNYKAVGYFIDKTGKQGQNISVTLDQINPKESKELVFTNPVSGFVSEFKMQMLGGELVIPADSVSIDKTSYWINDPITISGSFPSQPPNGRVWYQFYNADGSQGSGVSILLTNGKFTHTQSNLAGMIKGIQGQIKITVVSHPNPNTSPNLSNILAQTQFSLVHPTPSLEPQNLPSEVTVMIAKGSASNTNCGDQCFIPNTVQIAVGGEVTWLNADSAAHTVTDVNGNFDSSLISPAGKFTQKFNTAGTYAYMDIVHPWAKGTVVVGGSTEIPKPQPKPVQYVEFKIKTEPNTVVSLDKSQYPIGEIVIINGKGFDPTETISILISDLYQSRIEELSLSTTKSGTFQTLWKIPDGLSTGKYVIMASSVSQQLEEIPSSSGRVTISGKINPVNVDVNNRIDVTLRVVGVLVNGQSDNIVLVKQVKPSRDGSFVDSFSVPNPTITKTGDYKVIANYANLKSEVVFTYNGDPNQISVKLPPLGSSSNTKTAENIKEKSTKEQQISEKTKTKEQIAKEKADKLKKEKELAKKKAIEKAKQKAIEKAKQKAKEMAQKKSTQKS